MKPDISPDFTLDDIRKIRDYNYEMTKHMTLDELNEYIKKGASHVLEMIEKAKNADTASRKD